VTHVVDLFSKLSMACVGQNAETTVKLLTRWAELNGGVHPAAVITDNGSEFVAKKVGAYCATFNIRLLRSPFYSPSSNGAAERHGGVLKAIIAKLQQDLAPNLLDAEDIKAAAVGVKNRMMRRAGVRNRWSMNLC
jgi:transposase InsO family protein